MYRWLIAFLTYTVGAAILVAQPCAATVTVPSSKEVSIKRGYVDMRYGQLHYYIAKPEVRPATDRPPIVLLHQSSASAVEFGPLITELGRARVVLAIDSPGHGGSDGPTEHPSIAEFAESIAEGLRGLGFGSGKQIDLLGYHTGALIATELALLQPEMIRKAVLVGLYTVPESRWQTDLANLREPESYMDLVTQRCSVLPLRKEKAHQRGLVESQWVPVWIDGLRAGLSFEHGHAAAFRYGQVAKERVTEIRQPVLLIASDDTLRDDTIASQALFQNAELADFPDYTFGMFYAHPAELASTINSFLDNEGRKMVRTPGALASTGTSAEFSHVSVATNTQSGGGGVNERGETVFFDYCSFCHELSGPNPSESDHKGLLRQRTGKPFSEIELRTFIENPPPGMIKIPLKEEQLESLITYLRSLRNQALITNSGNP